MFTGIIEAQGTIERAAAGAGGGRVLTVRAPFADDTYAIGDSICTSGVCLTVTRKTPGAFSVDVGPETMLRTTLGALSAGAKVNLERSVTLETRLGGHLVQGHVDAVGRIAAVTPHENARDLFIEAPPEVLRLAVPRGSVAIDGISLTITGRREHGFSVMIIPHTWAVTTLGDKGVGSSVNLEADLLARYVAGLLDFDRGQGGGLSEELLARHGFPLSGAR